MTENTHQRRILISKREGGIFSPKRNQGERQKLPLGSPSQSVHFANGNPAKPLKTSRRRNFNRYTLHAFPASVSASCLPAYAFFATRHSRNFGTLATAFFASLGAPQRHARRRLCYTPPTGDPSPQ